MRALVRPLEHTTPPHANCDLQGPKGVIWAGEWASVRPFGTLSGGKRSWVHFGAFQDEQGGWHMHVPSQI